MNLCPPTAAACGHGGSRRLRPPGAGLLRCDRTHPAPGGGTVLRVPVHRPSLPGWRVRQPPLPRSQHFQVTHCLAPASLFHTGRAHRRASLFAARDTCGASKSRWSLGMARPLPPAPAVLRWRLRTWSSPCCQGASRRARATTSTASRCVAHGGHGCGHAVMRFPSTDDCKAPRRPSQGPMRVCDVRCAVCGSPIGWRFLADATPGLSTNAADSGTVPRQGQLPGTWVGRLGREAVSWIAPTLTHREGPNFEEVGKYGIVLSAWTGIQRLRLTSLPWDQDAL